MCARIPLLLLPSMRASDTVREKRPSPLLHLRPPHNRERVSRQNIVAKLRLRIKTLEEKNRELTSATQKLRFHLWCRTCAVGN